MRGLAVAAAVLGSANLAMAATVTIEKPGQGQTLASPIDVTVSVSTDFALGTDGTVELWVDGARFAALKGLSGRLSLTPGNHQLQARLIGPDGRALRVPTVSSQVQVTVPTVDPASP